MDSSIYAKGTVQQDVYAASQRAYILLRVLLTSSQTRMCTPPHSEPTYWSILCQPLSRADTVTLTLLVTNQDVYAASQRAYILVVYVLAAS